MDNTFMIINDLVSRRAELRAKLNLLPYDGTVEVKEISGKKYLYIRKKVLGKTTSTYVDVYSDDLYNLLVRNSKEARSLRKEIRGIDKELAKNNYSDKEISSDVILNLEFARSNMKRIIYDQAILEGVATTFPDTEIIIDNGKVKDVSTNDVLKILNLKHAWEFILDEDIINAQSDYYLASYLARLVNEGFFIEGGKLRNVPVKIGGTNYAPEVPLEVNVKEDIDNILNSKQDDYDIAIDLCLYVMKKQLFNDGNKRTAVIYANHYLISKGKGLLIIPYDRVDEFRKLLIDYYDDTNINGVKVFLKECINKF